MEGVKRYSPNALLEPSGKNGNNRNEQLLKDGIQENGLSKNELHIKVTMTLGKCIQTDPT